MKADQPSPAPTTQPGPQVAPGLEHHGPLPPKDDPSPVLVWLQNTWDKLKSGKIGNPKWIALIVAVGLIAFFWWYLARSSKKSDSALWFNYDLAVTQDGMKVFLDNPANTDTVAGRITRLNLARTRVREGLAGLTAATLADRQKAAATLEQVRDELVTLADEFTADRTLKSTCLLAAADAEQALIGIPKEGIQSVGLEVKQNGRGQVSRVAELKRRAADVIGADTEVGQKLIAEAEKMTQNADQVYQVAGTLNAAFNEPDSIAATATPPVSTPPATGEGPKPPDTIPDPVNPAKPDEKKPEEKKPEEQKPDEGPKPPAPLPAEKK